MGDKKTIILPDAATMLARLIAVNDMNHYQERFYPLLIKHAGVRVVPNGVVTALVLAIADYTNEFPPMVCQAVYEQADAFIDALVVDNAEAAAEAKKILAAVLAKAWPK